MPAAASDVWGVSKLEPAGGGRLRGSRRGAIRSAEFLIVLTER